MGGLAERVQDFFRIYQQANADFDVDKLAKCYADVFLFAGPAGVRAVSKSDFVKVLPHRKDFFRSIGLVSSTVKSIDTSALDSRYTLAKVTWSMQLNRGTEPPVGVETFATYILSATDDRFEVVVQVDHQDLAQRLQELGLAPSK